MKDYQWHIILGLLLETFANARWAADEKKRLTTAAAVVVYAIVGASFTIFGLGEWIGVWS